MKLGPGASASAGAGAGAGVGAGVVIWCWCRYRGCLWGKRVQVLCRTGVNKAAGPRPQGHSHRATATGPQPQGHSHRATATGPQPQGHGHSHSRGQHCLGDLSGAVSSTFTTTGVGTSVGVLECWIQCACIYECFSNNRQKSCFKYTISNCLWRFKTNTLLMFPEFLSK